MIFFVFLYLCCGCGRYANSQDKWWTKEISEEDQKAFQWWDLVPDRVIKEEVEAANQQFRLLNANGGDGKEKKGKKKKKKKNGMFRKK